MVLLDSPCPQGNEPLKSEPSPGGFCRLPTLPETNISPMKIAAKIWETLEAFEKHAYFQRAFAGSFRRGVSM